MAKSKFGKRSWLPLFVSAVCALSIAVVSLRFTGVPSNPANVRNHLGVPEQRKKIDTMISSLAGESFDQSVENLVIADDYYYPGYQSGRKMSQINLEEMLSNRRAVKVLNELATLPNSRTEQRCRSLFDAVFAHHLKAFQMAFGHADDPNAPENTQSLKATQLAVCVAVLATAKFADLAQQPNIILAQI